VLASSNNYADSGLNSLCEALANDAIHGHPSSSNMDTEISVDLGSKSMGGKEARVAAIPSSAHNPLRYLGLPLSVWCLRRTDFQHLEDKCAGRLPTWGRGGIYNHGQAR
jgi:hypothetical protein